MNIFDAIKSQPRLADEPGYKKWVKESDEEAFDEALEKWGFRRLNSGEIVDLES